MLDINGNTGSLKKTLLDRIASLDEIEFQSDEFLPWDLAGELAVLTSLTDREIAVYLNRRGKLTGVSIGDSSTVALPDLSGRRGADRLSGIRLIHTHPNGDARLSDVDMSSLTGMNLDAVISLGVRDGFVTAAFAALPEDDGNGSRKAGPAVGPYYTGQDLNHLFKMAGETERITSAGRETQRNASETAILVGMDNGSGSRVGGASEAERSLEELKELAITAGLKVIATVLQNKPVKDTALYLGKGKTEELSLMRQTMEADILVYDDELSGAQIRNIENATGAKVVDRTTLILDIFAQRARTSEGKLQVELAQLNYRLPRLMGLGGQLSRLGGGIGTRGPGEKKLESDRRHIRRRVSYLKNELELLSKRREHMRAGRKKSDIPVIALVGYTNSGKSTLLNKLCSSDVFAEDKLFATLDPTARRLILPSGRETLLVDTVGFIRKLPHDLVEAFKSTLEEAAAADLLLHVVDVADGEAREHIKVAEELLAELGASNKPVLLVLNKMDKTAGTRPAIPVAGKKASEISAITGEGITELLQAVTDMLVDTQANIEVFIPFEHGWAMSYLHQNGNVTRKEFTDLGISASILIDRAKTAKIREFIV